MSHREITIPSSRGAIACHWYPSLKQHGSVVFVGGAGGGWDTPARGLYPRLAHQLQQQGLACLRVRFRNSLELDEAVHDVVSGVTFLEMQGSTEFGFVGHSFGGAVVISAAAQTPTARAVVTLATQSYGTDAVSILNRRCATLVLHGTADEILPAEASQSVYARAHQPKELKLYQGARHGLDEAADQSEAAVREWLLTYVTAR